MIYGKEGLFAAITSPEWEVDERGDLFLYNQARDRRLFYTQWNGSEGGGEVFADLGLSLLDESGSWREIFLMKHSTTDRGEGVAFVVWSGKEGRSVFYDPGLEKHVSGKVRLEVPGDVGKLMYDPGWLPDKLDFEMTANSFLQQMINGEMDRPVLVPEGLFVYEEPTMGSESVAYSLNIKRASRLMAVASTKEEIRVARRIYSFVFDREADRIAGRE